MDTPKLNLSTQLVGKVNWQDKNELLEIHFGDRQTDRQLKDEKQKDRQGNTETDRQIDKQGNIETDRRENIWSLKTVSIEEKKRCSSSKKNI
jgi:hypothetical protein